MRTFAGVEGWLGYWGSGKSLEMCKSIMARQKHDPKLLIGNNFGYIHENAVDLKTIDEFVTFACMDTPGWRKVLAIDEVGGMARARGYSTFPPAADVVFQQGRKLGLSVLWTTQHWRLLDVNIRRVTQKVTECQGLFPKRISARRVRPVVHRPRIIRKRVFLYPNPDSAELPAESNYGGLSLFSQRAADSYDTMRLVQNYQEELQRQQEEASRSPLVHMVSDITQGLWANESV